MVTAVKIIYTFIHHNPHDLAGTGKTKPHKSNQQCPLIRLISLFLILVDYFTNKAAIVLSDAQLFIRFMQRQLICEHDSVSPHTFDLHRPSILRVCVLKNSFNKN